MGRLQLTESDKKEHEMLAKHYGTFDPWKVDMTWADWVAMHARQEGVDTGMRKVVLRQLEQKFGSLSDQVRRRVEGLSNGRIEELALSVLDAEGSDDLPLDASDD
jgi:hypothetical protein